MVRTYLDLNAYNLPAVVRSPGTNTVIVRRAGITSNIYVGFGSNAGTLTSSFNLFDGVTKLWSSKTAAPEALAFAASAVANGQLVTVGGFRQNNTSSAAVRTYVP
ncbi:MAG: hypothetical protein U0163_13720 [Gemmatimonadaceae bacterium]